jgi:hypothetical protein
MGRNHCSASCCNSCNLSLPRGPLQELHRLPLPRRRHVRVNLRGRHRLVPEHLLDRPEVGPAIQELRRERVPEKARVELDPEPFAGAPNSWLDGGSGMATSALSTS